MVGRKWQNLTSVTSTGGRERLVPCASGAVGAQHRDGADSEVGNPDSEVGHLDTVAAVTHPALTALTPFDVHCMASIALAIIWRDEPTGSARARIRS
jgi:hypothetical protein